MAALVQQCDVQPTITKPIYLSSVEVAFEEVWADFTLTPIQ
jgi:hypothetical protein